MAAVKKKRRRKPARKKKSIGFTNCLALALLGLLAAGLLGGFLLAAMSIRYQYMGALACYTVVFTPIGTAIGIVLGKIVDKSRAENTGANGDGIVYASAQAGGFGIEESPKI